MDDTSEPMTSKQDIVLSEDNSPVVEDKEGSEFVTNLDKENNDEGDKNLSDVIQPIYLEEDEEDSTDPLENDIDS